MRITCRIGTGSTPNTEHLEPGECVFDPDNRRLGIGIGGQVPVWYPGIDINGHLALANNQKISSMVNDSVVALDSAGPSLLFLNYNIARFTGVDAGVNSIVVSNAITTEAPKIAATGSDSNIELVLTGKGSNGVSLSTAGGTVQARAVHVANAVNHVALKGSIANTAVVVTAAGSSSTIDLKLSPKGPGYVQLDTSFSSTADSPITGYLSIKDSAGAVRKLAIIA